MKKYFLSLIAVLLFAILIIFISDIPEMLDRSTTLTGKVLASVQSSYQRIEIVDIPNFGKSLLLDGEHQLSEKDEAWYHEALVHPAMAMHSNPKNILIIGGGDGGAIKEFLKHKEVENVELVELDKKVIEISKKYFPWSEPAFSNPRVHVTIGEGRKFLETTEKKFDIIIVDLPDPRTSQVALLYTEEFYKTAAAALSSDGIIVVQAGSPFFTKDAFVSIYKTMSTQFSKVYPYTAWVPLFGQWGFMLACNSCAPENFRELNIPELKIYNADLHKAIFALPTILNNSLSDPNIKTNTDDQLILPIYMSREK